MMWPKRRDARLIKPIRSVNSKLQELETAKKILEEIFHVHPEEVEDMIQKRLKIESWSKDDEL